MPDRAIIQFLTTRAWMLHRPVLQSMVDIVNRHAELEKMAPEQVAAVMAARDERKAGIRRERRLTGRRLVAQSIFGDDRDERIALTSGGVGIYFVDGVVCKYADHINGISQPSGTCTADIIDGVHALGESSQVRRIVLDIDSPGGTVAGMDDVKEAIRQVSQAGTPVIAYAHDLCASGGYFIAACCDEIFSAPSSTIGSIGVLEVWEDVSARYEAMGIRRVVIATDDDKGIGVEGTAITDEQVAVLKAEIEELGDWFKGHVAARRSMAIEDVRALGARTWTGTVAERLGLIDGVAGFAELIETIEEDIAAAAA